MSEPKFTKGPWHVKSHESRFTPGVLIDDGVCGPDGEQIRVHGVTLTSSGEAKANARLIAAAPDLLEALELLADVYDAMGAPRGPARIKAGAAIAKALGAPTGPRFAMTSCSQCGKELGAGNSGVSHCDRHA